MRYSKVNLFPDQSQNLALNESYILLVLGQETFPTGDVSVQKKQTLAILVTHLRLPPRSMKASMNPFILLHFLDGAFWGKDMKEVSELLKNLSRRKQNEKMVSGLDLIRKISEG
ncbi:MAG: hypothetical protein AB1611_01385 [bacterium]